MRTTRWIVLALMLGSLVSARAVTIILQQGNLPNTAYAGSQDTYIRSDTPTATNGASPGLNVGTLAGTGANDMRSLLSFDLSLLPVNAVINSITLTLVARTPDASSTNTTLALQLNAVTQSFVGSQASWQNASTGTTWTSAGGTMGSTLSTSNISTQAASGTTLVFDTSTNFVSMAQSAYDNAQSLGLLIWAPTQESNTDRAFVAFNSNETTTLSLRPLLTIDYTVVPEPGSIRLALMGGFALSCLVWRRRF